MNNLEEKIIALEPLEWIGENLSFYECSDNWKEQIRQANKDKKVNYSKASQIYKKFTEKCYSNYLILEKQIKEIKDLSIYPKEMSGVIIQIGKSKVPIGYLKSVMGDEYTEQVLHQSEEFKKEYKEELDYLSEALKNKRMDNFPVEEYIGKTSKKISPSLPRGILNIVLNVVMLLFLVIYIDSKNPQGMFKNILSLGIVVGIGMIFFSIFEIQLSFYWKQVKKQAKSLDEIEKLLKELKAWIDNQDTQAIYGYASIKRTSYVDKLGACTQMLIRYELKKNMLSLGGWLPVISSFMLSCFSMILCMMS